MTVFGIAESQAVAKTIAKEHGLTVREDREAKAPSVRGTVITVPPPTIYNHKTYMQELHACINQASKPNRFFDIEPENDKQKAMLNIVRDMHCDRLEHGEYKGRDAQLKQRYDQRDLPLDDIHEQDEDIGRLLALGDSLRSQWQGSAPKRMSASLRDDVKRMQAIGDKWMSLETEEDIRELLRMLEQELPPGGAGDEGDDEGEQGGDPSGESGEGDPLDGDEGSGEGEEGKGSGDSDSESTTEGGEPSDGPKGEVSDELKEQLSSLVPDYEGDPADGGLAEQPDEPYTPHGEYRVLDSTTGKYSHDRDFFRSSSKMLDGFTLSKRIRKYLLTLIQTRTQTGLRSGKFAPNKVARLLTDITPGKQPRIYKQKTNSVVNTDVAISILLDHSGSMQGNRYNVTAACATAIHEVLASIGIAHDINTFSTENFNRCKPVHHMVKKWGERFVSRDILLQRLHRDSGLLFNNNADGESLMYAMASLVKRPEKDKLLLVLSDGQPACHHSFGDSDRYLKDVVGQVEAVRGVDVMGLGIETSSVKRYYKNHKVLDRVQELESILVELVRDKVVR